MSFEGEFCHPYIDRQIEIPEVAEAVNKLISEELERNPMPPYNKKKIPKPEYISVIENNACSKAKLQDLYHQEALCTVLSKRQKEFFESELTTQEQYINRLKIQEKQLENDILQINKRRYENQTKALPIFQNLQDKSLNLMHSIRKMEEDLENLKNQQITTPNN